LSRLFKASVKENKQVIKNHYLLTLHPLERTRRPKPGQFFMLSADDGLDPLLKRPFSLYRSLGQNFQFLYKTVGKATNILKKRKPGDILEITGPFGNGFPFPRKKYTPLLMGGGLGSVPLLNLAERIVNKKPRFFIGAKTKKELLCLSELKKIGIKPVISTDDGTSGEKGFITTVLKKFLTLHSSRQTVFYIYACGPKPMLKELALISNKFHVQAFVALEENMACGFGACLGCVVRTRHGFKRVCTEGPVFPIDEIIW
jgi:dihydroorotate dehydrogenase electron transfer subunit